MWRRRNSRLGNLATLTSGNMTVCLFQIDLSFSKSPLHFFNSLDVFFQMWRPDNAIVFNEGADVCRKSTNQQLLWSKLEHEYWTGYATEFDCQLKINLAYLLTYLFTLLSWCSIFYTPRLASLVTVAVKACMGRWPNTFLVLITLSTWSLVMIP